eukprot:177405_1
MATGFKSSRWCIAILLFIHVWFGIYYFNIGTRKEEIAIINREFETVQLINYSDMDLKIMTFNVFGFQNDHKNINISVRSLIINGKADVVLIQEDSISRKQRVNGIIVDGYERVIECKTHPNKRNSCANSILVSKQYLNKNHIFNTKSIDVTEGCPTHRCAAYVLFDNGISIVNTHFCGGKYDDRNFAERKFTSESIVYAKNNALYKIWKKFGNFTIIGGDFNGMKNKSLNDELFQTYPLFQQMNSENQKQFANFFQTPHILLKQNGYYSAYDEQMAIKTAQIGPKINVPDWIYINSQIKYIVKEVNILDAITYPFDVSDHNPVTVTFNLESDVGHSKMEESIQKWKNGYYVLYTDVFDCVAATSQKIIVSDTCNLLNNQIFIIQQYKNNYYTIQSNHSKLYWTMSVNEKSSKLYVNEEEYNGDDNQLFEFIHLYNNSSHNRYKIRVKQNGKFLTVSSSTKSSAIFQQVHREKNSQLYTFTVYDYLSEKRRQSEMETFINNISVEECIDNIPIIQKCIKNNIINPTQTMYFVDRTPQEITNITTNGYKKNIPTNAIKFIISNITKKKQYNNSETIFRVYHGVVNQQNYENILLKHEGLKGFVNYIPHLNISHLGPIVFVTPSYILASYHYATMYTFKDYVYSVVLEVTVDITKMIKTLPNTCGECKNIDPNILDDEIEWIYKEADIQISGLIVKKYKQQTINKFLGKSHRKWINWKLKHP